MIHTLKRALADIGGALIPDTKRLGLFADTSGNWYAIDSTGAPKLLGNGIQSITKTGSDGPVDTYIVTLTDGSTSTITVTNGSVTSVNGRTGDVTLNTDDVGEDEDATNLYHTPARASAAAPIQTLEGYPVDANKNIKLDPLNLAAVESLPPEPMPDTIRLFARKAANRLMASSMGPSGQPIRFQPHLGTNRMSLWQPNGAGNILATQFGGLWTNTAMTAQPQSDTPIGRIRRAQASTAATAGSIWQLNTDVATAAGQAYSTATGFHVIGHWAPITALDTRRFFVGVSPLAFTNVPLSVFQGVGLQVDSGQELFSVRGFDGAATFTAFSSVDPNAWYRFELFCPPGGDVIGWQLMNLLTGDFQSGQFIGDQLPPPSQFMHVRCQLMSTTGISSIAMGHWSVETDL